MLDTAQFVAAAEGDAQAVAAWLDKGGGVDARCSERGDSTLLMAAAYGGQKAVVRMLLQRGASVNLQDSLGHTALMAATANGHTTIVQPLLDAKADASLQQLRHCGMLLQLGPETCRRSSCAIAVCFCNSVHMSAVWPLTDPDPDPDPNPNPNPNPLTV